MMNTQKRVEELEQENQKLLAIIEHADKSVVNHGQACVRGSYSEDVPIGKYIPPIELPIIQELEQKLTNLRTAAKSASRVLNRLATAGELNGFDGALTCTQLDDAITKASQ